MTLTPTTLSTLNEGDIFLYAGIKFTVLTKRELINVIIGGTDKGCYLPGDVIVEVFK